MKTNVIRFSLLVILAVCGSCSSYPESAVESTEAEAPAQLASLPNDLYSNGITKLIKTANYRFQVENVQKSTDAIELAVRKYLGFISSSDLQLNHPILESKITIRVQNEFFQDLLKEIDKEAKFVNFRDVKTEDVSKQFVDLESRLKTKREVEQRYIEILRKKTGTIEELLSAEKQIGQLQEEIEVTISRINFLKDEVRYSTINLDFYQTVPQENFASDYSVGNDMLDALASGWDGLLTVVTGILFLWPWIIIGVAGSLIFISRRKRRVVAS